jgi:hypothetical protein
MIDCHEGVSIDIGTGAGQAVLRRAREHPAELVIGLDADARAMSDASRRASATERRGGLPNVIFLAAAVEELPGLLSGTADRVSVALPWGSLLLSATDRDSAAAGSSLEDDDDVARLAAAYEALGLQVVERRPARESDVDRLSSAWGRRLGIPARRRAWLIRGCRQPPASGAGLGGRL